MSINGEPSFQYADAGNLFEHTGDPELNEALESASQTLYSAESLLATLESMKDRLQTEKAIDRTTANTLKTLTTSMESMQEHFSRHPVRSYTERPSATNLNPTLEGLIGNIAKAVWDVITSIFKFIFNFIKDLVGLKQKKNADLKKVQKGLSEDLKVLTKTKVEVAVKETPTEEPPAKPTTPTLFVGSPMYMALDGAIRALSPLATQAVAGSGPTDEFVSSNGGLSGLIAKLGFSEKLFITTIKTYADNVKKAMESVNRIITGVNADGGMYSPAQYGAILSNAISSIEFRPPGYDGVYVKEDAEARFGESAKAYYSGVLATFRAIQPVDLDFGGDPIGVINRIVTVAASANLENIAFVDANEYTKIKNILDGVYDSIQGIKSRFGNNEHAARLCSNVSRDVKAASDSMQDMEDIINQFRIVAGRILVVTRMYRKIIGA